MNLENARASLVDANASEVCHVAESAQRSLRKGFGQALTPCKIVVRKVGGELE